MTFNRAVDIECDQRDNQKTKQKQRELKMFMYLGLLVTLYWSAINITNSNHSILNPNLSLKETAIFRGESKHNLVT